MAALPQPSFPSVIPSPLSAGARQLASGISGRGGDAWVPNHGFPPSLLSETVTGAVLVVEPDPRSRSVLGAALARGGFEVVAVATAEEALRQVSFDRPLPVVVVAEVGLPGVDGFGLCSQLRADVRTAQLPILLLSRTSESVHRELATVAGADDYLAKPVYVKDVVSLVRLRASPRAVDGRLEVNTSALPLPELLRALLAGVRAGRVELLGGRARIVFRDGQIVDAWLEKERGESALQRILLLAEGSYQVSFGPSLDRAAFSMNLRDFCSRLQPQALRWRERLSRSVPLESVLALDFARFTEHLPQLPDEIHTIVRLFDGKRTVLQVVLESPVEEVLSLAVITRLNALGIVVPAPAASTELLSSEPAFFEPGPPPTVTTPAPASPITVASEPEASGPEASPPPDELFLAFAALSSAAASVASSAEELLHAAAPTPAEELLAGRSDPSEPLAEDVQRQLDAFRIRPVVELPIAEVGQSLEEVASEWLESAQPELMAQLERASAEETARSDFADSTAPVPVRLEEEQPAGPLLTLVENPQSPEPALLDAVAASELIAAPASEAKVTPQPLEDVALESQPERASPVVLLPVIHHFPKPQPAGAVALGRLRPVEVGFTQESSEASLSLGQAVKLQEEEARSFDEFQTPVATPQVSVELPGSRLRTLAIVGGAMLLIGSAAAVTVWKVTDRKLPRATNAILANAGLEPALAAGLVTTEEVIAPNSVQLSERALEEGIRLYEAGRAHEAASVLESSVKENKSSATAWLYLGLARFDSSDTEGAEQAAHEALMLDPVNGRAVLLLATVYLDSGQRAEAEAQLRYYLDLEPNGPYAQEARQLLQAQ